ncbi:SGNH/GDSL hydrolase family protein [Rhizobium leguminosarum]
MRNSDRLAIKLNETRAKLLEAIEREQQVQDKKLQVRVAAADGRIARAKKGSATVVADPLRMLAIGDSWFDYPLLDNGPVFKQTDIIRQLEDAGKPKPIIVPAKHWGYTSVVELSLPMQKRIRDALTDKANWGRRGKPDAILLSAGGNDIAGEQFCIFVNNAGQAPLNEMRLKKALGIVEAAYEELFDLRDMHAKGVTIYGHCYDFAVPDGGHPACIGPWLQPSFEFSGQTDLAANTQAVADTLKAFKALLVRLAGKASNHFVLLNTQGTLSTSDWANELHPKHGGFAKIMEIFRTQLANDFPGRI